jgi:alpha-2-macroglobulin
LFQQASAYHTDAQNQHYNLVQAYRLYTLALAGRPNISAMNRLRESNNTSIAAKWRLAAAYLLAGKPEAAENLTKTTDILITQKYVKPGITFGSQLRDKAMILETLTLMGAEEQAFDLAVKISQEMKTEYLNTQTAAFTIYALSLFAGETGQNHESNFDISMDGEIKSIRTKIPVYKIELTENLQSLNVKNNGKGMIYITKTISGKLSQKASIAEQKNLKLNVKYQTIDGKSVDVAKLQQGTDFEAVITVTNPGLLGDYENLALEQIFPAGWEIINTRYASIDLSGNSGESPFGYRDVRDDRVITFFNLPANQSVTFKVALNAAYTGSYFLPGSFCSAMYENNIYASETGKWIEVVKLD